ncbi:hypothetical protein [Micromonospora globbae]|uniref:nSTAND1 domain-containing NTPase n=1 Tax=Micromonospora globbae TaxID=1894969 RepID=UPI00386BAEE7|nr:hypothetical protein OH732_21615 [Micromonospora globbae]
MAETPVGPDPTEVADRRDFARALTELWRSTDLSVRDLAKQANGRLPGSPPVAGHTTINDWLTGRSCPSPSSRDFFVAVLGACGVTDDDAVAAWLTAWRRVRQIPGPRGGVEPYRGLGAFQPEHADWFFGREELTEELVGRVRALAARGGGVQLVVGPSGSGKSSLLRAGLIAALGRDGADRPDGWRTTLGTPATLPLDRLAAVPESASDARRLVVVDQFEELFTGDRDADAQARYVNALCALAGPSHGTVVVLGVRADFYHRILGHPALAAATRDGQITVGPMTEAEIRRAIVEPARRAKLDVESGLVELLLRDIAPRPDDGRHGFGVGVLPLLSHALYATWRQDRGRSLTVAAYRRTGGITGAVAQSADEIYCALDPDDQELTRRLFVSLVQVNADAADTRRRLTKEQVVAEAGAGRPGRLPEIVDRFVAHRLITTDVDTVEISHEALIFAWPTLRDWLDKDRDALLLRAQVTAAAASWLRENRSPDALYQGTRLATALDWAAGQRAELPPSTLEFLDASSRHERQRTRRLHQVIAVLLGLTLALGSVAAYALHQRAALQSERETAVAQRKVAVSRMLAGRADRLRATDPALAKQLSLAAYRIAPTHEARSSVLDSYAGPTATRLGGFAQEVQALAVDPRRRLVAAGSADRSVRLWRVGDAPAPTPVGPPLDGPTDTIYAVAFSPDGATLAAAGGDGRLHLWSVAADGRPAPAGAPLTGPTSTIYSVAFSPDGRMIVAGSADGRIHRWRVTPGRPAVSLPPVTGPGEAVRSVALSPDGRFLAAGDERGAVRVWDAPGTTRPPLRADLRTHALSVLSVAFSPDSRLLATGSKDATVRLWDLSGPGTPTSRTTPLTGATSWVNSVAFSRDGAFLAAGTSDKAVLVWDTGTGRLTDRLPHPAQVMAVAYGPDGRTVVSGAGDATVRVWELPGPILKGAGDTIFNLSFSGPDDRLVAASRDRTVRLWRANDPRRAVSLGRPLTSTDPAAPYAATTALRADGQLLAVGTRTGPVHLWTLADPSAPSPAGPPLTGLSDLVETLAFSPDGRLLIGGGDDHTIVIWNVADPRRPALVGRIPGTGAIINAVAVSPDGRTLAVGSTDNVVRIVDITDPAAPVERWEPLGPFNGYVYSVAFSDDGRLLAAGSADRTVRLWTMHPANRPTEVSRPLTGPGGNVYWVAFNPADRSVAAAAGDGSVWIWDTRGEPAVIATLTSLTGPARVLAFAPSGRTLATAGEDRLVRLWDVDPDRVAAWICATAGEPISRQEWDQYVPNEPYAPPC